MGRYHAILFDMDGTLLDTLTDMQDAVNHVLAAHGLPLRTREEVRRFVGNGAGPLIHRALPEGYPQEQKVLAEYRAYYQAHNCVQTCPYPGIPELLERLRRATAVFTVSDFYALDLMCFLSEHGLAVPDDISVAGFDDTPMCELVRPALTTVRQDAVLRAKLAVEKLRELREGKPVQPEYTLPVSLVVRGSTGPRCLSNHTILQT